MKDTGEAVVTTELLHEGERVPTLLDGWDSPDLRRASRRPGRGLGGGVDRARDPVRGAPPPAHRRAGPGRRPGAVGPDLAAIQVPGIGELPRGGQEPPRPGGRRHRPGPADRCCRSPTMPCTSFAAWSSPRRPRRPPGAGGGRREAPGAVAPGDAGRPRCFAASRTGSPSGPVPSNDQTPITRARSSTSRTRVTSRSSVPFIEMKPVRASRMPGAP